MISTIRPHAIKTDSALNRRRVVENFLWTARRLSTLDGEAVGDKVLGRDAFTDEAWYEIKGSNNDVRTFRLPRDGFLIPDTMLEIEHDDSFFHGHLRWSLEAEMVGADLLGTWASKFLMVFPVVDGKAIYGGMDIFMMDQLIAYEPTAVGVPAADPEDETSQKPGPQSPGDVIINSAVNPHMGKVGMGNNCTVIGLNAHSHITLCCRSIGAFRIRKATVTHRKVLR